MKRLLISLVVAVLVTAVLLVALYFTGGEAWRTFLETQLWPTVASIATSIFGIYLLVSPVLSRLNVSSGTMGGAAKAFAAALAELTNANKKNAEQEARIALLENELELQKKVAHETERRFGKLCRVFAIGWGADERMVKSGAAREMMKVVEEYERENDEEA